MNNILLRSIAVGLLIGLALFVMPFFLIRLVFFVLIIGALFRLFGRRRFGRGWGPWGQDRMPAFTDRIRQMSDEEYNQFKQRYQNRWDYDAPESTPKTDNQNQ